MCHQIIYPLLCAGLLLLALQPGTCSDVAASSSSASSSTSSASSSSSKQIANSGHSFPVHIGAEGHIVQGRISADAPPGTMVPSNVVLEGENDADFRVHLRVEVRDSVYTRPHVFHPDIKINTSDPKNPQFEHPVIEFVNGSLPYGMEFVVIHTNAFYVNEDRYICVNDLQSLEDENRIHFDVILKDKLAETHYVSNQLPFVVEIEYPVREAHPKAALFAGVLVLIILAVSLLIPFVVRAKRRSKAGKPIFGCGSAEEGGDTESNGIIPDHGKQRVMSIGGKENLAMILDNGRYMHQRPSVDQNTTIQNRMLRSTSSMVFQPHWMDPHYSDVYERPDYSHMPAHMPAHMPGHMPTHMSLHMPLQGPRVSQDGSDSTSSDTYPPNFNTNLHTRTGDTSTGRTANGDVTTDAGADDTDKVRDEKL
ncbi:uncharacterized protein LOC131931723 isoform X2 [Physella acuta]|uniref:uncharacterized protein LOC131931723 isoform X2 n=1 Tax=Physella acuta TaxID=109671 RepID=UPI0027DAD8C8|nr:uncharacterized protein LOC131931723 isoform X2 [Physella acuta]